MVERGCKIGANMIQKGLDVAEGLKGTRRLRDEGFNGTTVNESLSFTDLCNTSCEKTCVQRNRVYLD